MVVYIVSFVKVSPSNSRTRSTRGQGSDGGSESASPCIHPWGVLFIKILPEKAMYFNRVGATLPWLRTLRDLKRHAWAPTRGSWHEQLALPEIRDGMPDAVDVQTPAPPWLLSLFLLSLWISFFVNNARRSKQATTCVLVVSGLTKAVSIARASHCPQQFDSPDLCSSWPHPYPI